MPIKTFLKKQYLTFSCKVRIHKIKKVRALVHPWAGRCSLKKKVFSLTEALIRPVLVYSLLLCMCAPCACVRAVQLSAQSKKSQRSKVTEIKFFNNGDEKTFRAQNYCFYWRWFGRCWLSDGNFVLANFEQCLTDKSFLVRNELVNWLSIHHD